MSEPKSTRGFASMDPAKQRAIASMGGKAVPAAKRSFTTNRKLAHTAGIKGGMSVPKEKRTFSKDRKLASRAGKKGGVNIPPEKRSFSQDNDLAVEAGRKGGEASACTKNLSIRTIRARTL